MHTVQQHYNINVVPHACPDPGRQACLQQSQSVKRTHFFAHTQRSQHSQSDTRSCPQHTDPLNNKKKQCMDTTRQSCPQQPLTEGAALQPLV
jgi:hypothetical protein